MRVSIYIYQESDCVVKQWFDFCFPAPNAAFLIWFSNTNLFTNRVLPSVVLTQFSPRDLQLLCGPFSQGCFLKAPLKSQGTSHNAQHHVISLKDTRWLKTGSLHFWQFLKVISGVVGKINLVPVFPFCLEAEKKMDYFTLHFCKCTTDQLT